MALHELYREQVLPISVKEAWDFFATPKNLNRITPEELKFQVLTDVPDKMYPGLLIEYRIQILPGIWQDWVTEIKYIEEEKSFVDEQRFGPYKFWFHRHTFTAEGEHVRMVDHVRYALPSGSLGKIVNALYVKKQLNYIFNYRLKVLEEIFPANAS